MSVNVKNPNRDRKVPSGAAPIPKQSEGWIGQRSAAANADGAVGPASIPDAADRRAARLCLNRNIVVEAGAGTGKTTLLTDRILFALLGAGFPVTRVVALTFTEKAAGEIQLRLNERLIQLLSFLDGNVTDAKEQESTRSFLKELSDNFGIDEPAVRVRAQAALENLDKAAIGTLHRFAANLLRAYPLQSGVDPAFQVDEGEKFEELFESEWARWLDVELGENAPREAEWIALLRRASLESIQALAKELCHPRVRLDRFCSIPESVRTWLRETIEILGAEPRRQPPSKGNIADRIREVVSRLKELEACADSPRSRKISANGTLPGGSWPKGWDNLHQERFEVACKIAEKCSVEGEILLQSAIAAVAPFVLHYNRAYRWRGLLSFDGILTSARDLVRDHPEVREELKGEFDAFLVDEFQDTDPLQGELLMFLAEEKRKCAREWMETTLEAGKLFVVGDPKQSIYRFRGADLAAYEKFIRHMLDREPKAAFCKLTTNFRSHRGILSPVNDVFSKIMTYEEGLQPVYRAIEPRPDAVSSQGAERRMELVLVESKNGEQKTGVDAIRRTEAEWIIRWILEQCGDDKPYRFKDVAVLLRTTTPLPDYLEVFKEKGVPYVVEGEKYFYGTQEVQDFLNILRAIDDPKNPLPLVGLLRSPIVGLTDPEIVALCDGKAITYLKDPSVRIEGLERVKAFFSILRRLRGSVGRRPLGEVVRSALEDTHVLELLSTAYYGEQTMCNLLKFGRMAAQSADADGQTLPGFIRSVMRSVQEAREEGESPLADESLDAVRILTIHKSKGLEFPVVLVPNLAGSIRGGGDSRSVSVDWNTGALGVRLPQITAGAAYAYQEMMEKVREKKELIRILYVAMTRAKDRLILIGSDKGDKNSLSAKLEEAGLWPEGTPAVKSQSVDAGKPMLAEEDAPNRISSGVPLPPLGKLAEQWKMRLNRRDAVAGLRRFESATSLSKGHSRRAAIPRIDQDVESSIKAPSSPAVVGEVCHKVLQNADFKSGWNAKRLSDACEMMRRTYPNEEWKTIEPECAEILRRFFASPAAAELAAGEIVGREIPFAFARGNQVVRGSIDLLCRIGGRLTVVDFKTDRIESNEAAERASEYRDQGRVYAEAVRLAGGQRPEFRVVFLRIGKTVDVSVDGLL